MIYNLSKENKKEVMNIMDNQHCVCLYYWNLCGHCEMLMPIWKKLCKKYMKNTSINIINIELDNMNLLKSKYTLNINGYPTIIKYIKGNRNDEFQSKRDMENLDMFIKKK